MSYRHCVGQTLTAIEFLGHFDRAIHRRVATATLEKRGPNQWRVKIRRRGYPLQTRTFETKATAARYIRRIEREMDGGVFVSHREAETTTLGELLERYLEEVTPKKKGADSESYRIRALLRHPLAARRRMSSYTVVQVSDTHLSRTHGYFYDNWLAFLAEMEALTPDLVLHCGGLSFNARTRPGIWISPRSRWIAFGATGWRVYRRRVWMKLKPAFFRRWMLLNNRTPNHTSYVPPRRA